MSQSSSATLVVLYKVAEGAEEDFKRIQDEFLHLAKKKPGFLERDVIPPSAETDGKWVVVAKFDSEEHLRAWTTDPARQELLKKADAVLEESPSFRSLKSKPAAPEPVALVFSHIVLPGKVGAFKAWHESMNAELRKCAGFVRTELFEPVEGVTDEWVNLEYFDSWKDAEAWMKSPMRQEMVQEVSKLVHSFSMERVGSGLEPWFKGGAGEVGAMPPNWKQIILVLIALYPTVMVIAFYIAPALYPGLPMPVGMLISNMLSVAALTFLLMPFVSKSLARWSTPEAPSWRTEVLGTVALLALLVLFCFLFMHLPRIN